ncbi:hypothetical protein [Actinomadura rubrisoli]|uniref:Uncharacterized protein n=1 Tax=Actinomadura rubrisoli TaxID=2530368 RepID=A0A4R5BL80_9ACTN|nr:hypothetical protein [Actinomadura rubrisoli]TDD86103.1 hypothetical protein E1298_17840 [Actinomadura rubrisoli]
MEILPGAAEPMRAGQIATAMGLGDEAAKREGLRSKLKRLVERGWACEDGPGLFTLAEPVARQLGRAGRRADGWVGGWGCGSSAVTLLIWRKGSPQKSYPSNIAWVGR